MSFFKFLNIFFIFFTIVGSSFALNSKASFSVQNYPPEIRAITQEGNSIIVQVYDKNGYNNLIDNVLIKSDNLNQKMILDHIDKNMAYFTYPLQNNEPYVNVMVTDGEYSVFQKFTIANIPKKSSPVTGFSTASIDNKGNFVLIFVSKIKSYFKK